MPYYRPRNYAEVRVDGEQPGFAIRKRLSFQPALIRKVMVTAFGVRRDRHPWVHPKFVPRSQAEMRPIVSNASGKPLVVRMQGVLFGPILADVI